MKDAMRKPLFLSRSLSGVRQEDKEESFFLRLCLCRVVLNSASAAELDADSFFTNLLV